MIHEMLNCKFSGFGNYMFTLNEIRAFDQPDKVVLFVLERLTKVLFLSLFEKADLIVFHHKL